MWWEGRQTRAFRQRKQHVEKKSKKDLAQGYLVQLLMIFGVTMHSFVGMAPPGRNCAVYNHEVIHRSHACHGQGS